MATITITPETKSTLTITNESKPTGGTFGSSPGRTFADGGTFGEPGLFITKETKSTLTITNETK